MDIEENISKINEHIERAKEYLEYGMPYSEYLDLQISFETILNELDKKDKIIEDIKFINNNNKPHIAQQKIRGYFTNKVEEDK